MISYRRSWLLVESETMLEGVALDGKVCRVCCFYVESETTKNRKLLSCGYEDDANHIQNVGSLQYSKSTEWRKKELDACMKARTDYTVNSTLMR